MDNTATLSGPSLMFAPVRAMESSEARSTCAIVAYFQFTAAFPRLQAILRGLAPGPATALPHRSARSRR